MRNIAYPAPHDPLMAWPQDIAKYDGVNDVGYGANCNARCQKQINEGLINEADFPLSPAMYQDWASLSAAEKADQVRRRQVYAAMIDQQDREIGEVITQLQQMGVYDDMLILFCSGNRVSYSGRRGLVCSEPLQYHRNPSMASTTKSS